MANPELIEYAENQLKAGSSVNYIRTVLIKQGWGERDVDDALGIAQSELGVVQEAAAVPAATPGAAKPSGGGIAGKLFLTAGILTGILFLISAALSIIDEVGLMAFTFNIMNWIIAIVQLLAGVFWIIVGIMQFKK